MHRRRFLRSRERDIAALGKAQQIVRGAIAGDELAFRIMGDPYGRGHGIEEGLEFRSALPLLALAFH